VINNFTKIILNNLKF